MLKRPCDNDFMLLRLNQVGHVVITIINYRCTPYLVIGLLENNVISVDAVNFVRTWHVAAYRTRTQSMLAVKSYYTPACITAADTLAYLRTSD